MPDLARLPLSRADIVLWIRWVIVTAAVIGLCAGLGPIGYFIGPVLLGVGQALVLRFSQGPALAWGLATVIGGYFGLIALTASIIFINPWVGVFIGAAILGVAQAIALQGTLRHGVWWPLVSILALMIGVGWFVPQGFNAMVYGSQRPAWVWALMGVGCGALGGALKGGMWVLLQRRRPTPSLGSED
ncbi:MAG: hypothetical protein IGR92_07860 [Leptolyngbyaceae cyanobacterium T60_A2020_046]|nr:hypothetical protein [Leptolyngbyaceae cyanobacterium T60_A2020_046]